MIVLLDGKPIWGELYDTPSGVRLRLDEQEWRTLGVEVGQRVRVSTEGRQTRTLLVVEAVPIDAVCWLVLSDPIRAKDRDELDEVLGIR